MIRKGQTNITCSWLEFKEDVWYLWDVASLVCTRHQFNGFEDGLLCQKCPSGQPWQISAHVSVSPMPLLYCTTAVLLLLIAAVWFRDDQMKKADPGLSIIIIPITSDQILLRLYRKTTFK
jgi:hypothetical protein